MMYGSRQTWLRDGYGLRPWVFAAIVITVVLAAAGSITAAILLSGSAPATSLVEYKEMQYQGNAWAYYLVLANGQRVAAPYGTWNGAQPGLSTSTYPASSTASNDEDPDVTDPDTQYSIPSSAVSAAASTATVSIPDDDESFPVEDEDP